MAIPWKGTKNPRKNSGRRVVWGIWRVTEGRPGLSPAGRPEAEAMESWIQIQLRDPDYAEQLSQSLRCDPAFAECRIVCGDRAAEAGEAGAGVLVIDLAHLSETGQSCNSPAKTVLIASEAVDFGQIWAAGIVSVLQHSESLEHVKLAILAALLRPTQPRQP